MKIYRFLKEEKPHFALVDRQRTLCTADSLAAVADGTAMTSACELDLRSEHLLAPVLPGKIVAVGRNYAEHARELGNLPPAEPILFLKPPSAVLAPGGAIEIPPESERVDYEGELAVVIGRRARRIPSARWRDYVLGFTCANDVTARDLQKKDVQFTRGKGFDTFAPLGPCIETDLDVSDLSIMTRVNGALRQSGSTSQMIFPPGALLELITAVMTLEPGDVVLTGTPAGVGPLHAGDLVEVEIEGIGVLQNSVVAAS
ncbi:MAG TPA: fumarylacetoacetate hydrolase family protein [Thermoanaerobaculia bacterium]|nr:fumarylacetoacetate hydrolase family protein [Thermoanaerobaculia bacterium]